MLTLEQIKELINECRKIGGEGLKNGSKASIPELTVDVLNPPHDFLGINGNPAIFVNDKTFKLLGSGHSSWVADKTIALQAKFLKESAINVVGAIVHETGHAFNVAGKIPNSEGNAYVFEIEVMQTLFQSKKLAEYNCSAEDVQTYFNSRLSYYNKGVVGNKHLSGLVEDLGKPVKSEPKIIPVSRVHPPTPPSNVSTPFNLFPSLIPSPKGGFAPYAGMFKVIS